MEAKATAHQLETLVQKMNLCRGSVFSGHKVTDHKKCQALNRFGLRWFWGAALGHTRELYQVELHGTFARLHDSLQSDVLRYTSDS